MLNYITKYRRVSRTICETSPLLKLELNMEAIAINVDPENLRRIRKALLDAGANELKTTNKYEEFRLRVGSGFAIAYSKGKITATNAEAHEALKQAVRLTGSIVSDAVFIGSDEAGKGEWLGPLVVAAVALAPESVTELRAEGVMDSKDLMVKRIKELSSPVKRRALASDVVVINPKNFNELFYQAKQEKKSLNNILAEGHSKAVKSVYEQVSQSGRQITVTIDEFDRIKTNRSLSWLMKKENVTVIQKHRAEEEIEVAGASILARAERERWIDSKSEELSIDLRAISEDQALRMENREELFKTSYLKSRS